MSPVLETPPPSADRTTGRFVCKHCGTPSAFEEFCCNGCAYVHRLLHEHGYDSYYQIKDKVTAPADAALLPPRDYRWLAEAQHQVENAAGDRTPVLHLDIQGVSCAGCVWLIERIFSKHPGGGQIDVNAQTGQLRLSWIRGAFDAPAFARTLQSFGYLVSPASVRRTAHPESRGLIRRVGLCAAFAMNVMLFTLPTYFGMHPGEEHSALFGTLSLAFATLSLVAGGGYFLQRAVHSLATGVMNIDLPIAIGIVGAYAGSLYGWLSGVEAFVYFDFVASFIVLMLVGRWAQVAAVEKNQRRLLAQQPTPPALRVWVDDERTVDRRPETLQAGERYALGAGQTVPVESRLRSDAATFSLAWINGEAEPRTFRGGQSVPAGAINATRNELRLEATQGWSHSLLAELLRPVARATYRHRFIERVISGYLIGILVTAVATGLGWWYATGNAVQTWATVTAVLVVSCPCAIGLAFPLADEIATVILRKRGVFVRAPDLWPRLARVRQIAFDKTGTLTLETPCLVKPAALHALDQEAKAALLALVQDNPHPIGRCLHEHLLSESGVEPMPGEIEERVGQGVQLKSPSGIWKLGRAGWACAERTPPPDAEGAEAVLTHRDTLVAEFSFTEELRRDAAAETARLRQRGLALLVLSGDRQEKVQRLAQRLGFSDTSVHGDLRPGDKAAWIGKHGGDVTLMLGDGANDSLAFDAALCRGTPVIHRGVLEEKADFYYLGRGIEGIRALFEVDDARRRTHRWLLAFSIAYNALAVGLAVAGQMSPLLAAILMPVSSLLTLVIVGQGMRRA